MKPEQVTEAVKNILLYHDCLRQLRSDIKPHAGEWIRGIRRGHEISLRKLAAELGIEPSYLSKVENNLLPLTIPLAKAIVDFVEVRR